MTEKPPRHLVTLSVLLILSAITVTISSARPAWLAAAILTIALVKMLLVAFRFMNLRLAHPFWQAAVTLITCAFIATLFMLSIN